MTYKDEKKDLNVSARMHEHVDDFIEDWDSDSYAVWMFLYFRLPAMLHAKVEPHMRNHRLFCTYAGSRYRVTGASRMGDIWLATDHSRSAGYDLREDINQCSEWGPKP